MSMILTLDRSDIYSNKNVVNLRDKVVNLISKATYNLVIYSLRSNRSSLNLKFSDLLFQHNRSYAINTVNEMTQYLTVPWFNSAEFKNVYKDIFGKYTSVQAKRRALDILTVWKNRSPVLSSGIESTFSLLEVLVPDLENGGGDISSIGPNVLRLAYCTALMRFVNHSLDVQQAKGGGSLYQAARKLNVPDWVIKLRHDTAHGHSLPSIELLRKATVTALKWLQENYWKPHSERVTDYFVGSKLYKCKTDMLEKLTSFYMMISVCNSSSKVKRISDIPLELKECIIMEAKDIFTKYNNRVINMEAVTISSLLDSTSGKLLKLLKNDYAGSIIIKTVLSQDSLFFSLDVLKLVNDDHHNQPDSLVQGYISIWETMLTFLHTNDLILDFILTAIQFTKDSSMCKESRKLAALWIKEILRALHKSMLFVNMIKKLDFQSNINISNMTRRDQKMLLYKKCPNEKFGLTLDLTKPVPHQLQKINYVQKIICNYNTYTGVFIKQLLQLLEPKLSKDTAKKLCTISKLISADNISPSDFKGETKIYNVNDIKSQTVMDTNHVGSSDDSDCIITGIEADTEVDEEMVDMGVWCVVQAGEDWSNCPIAVLPWQVELVK